MSKHVGSNKLTRRIGSSYWFGTVMQANPGSRTSKFKSGSPPRQGLILRWEYHTSFGLQSAIVVVERATLDISKRHRRFVLDLMPHFTCMKPRPRPRPSITTDFQYEYIGMQARMRIWCYRLLILGYSHGIVPCWAGTYSDNRSVTRDVLASEFSVCLLKKNCEGNQVAAGKDECCVTQYHLTDCFAKFLEPQS
jgi:hypothetical protein